MSVRDSKPKDAPDGLEDQIAAFIAGGGKVQEVAQGVQAIDYKKVKRRHLKLSKKDTVRLPGREDETYTVM